MMQIAADELDVAVERIEIRSGDTDLTPNEGYTAGSQSIQFGGIAQYRFALRSAQLFAGACIRPVGCEAAACDGGILRNGAPSGHDYWTLAGAVNLATNATGRAVRKPASEYTVIGRSAARLDLPAKIFGEAAFIHDMVLDGAKCAAGPIAARPSHRSTKGDSCFIAADRVRSARQFSGDHWGR